MPNRLATKWSQDSSGSANWRSAAKAKSLPPMALHTKLTPAEAADRLALRELFDAYAHCADRRDADEQKALFTDNTVFAVYMNGEGTVTEMLRRQAGSGTPLRAYPARQGPGPG
jgi:hypothetical protein